MDGRGKAIGDPARQLRGPHRRVARLYALEKGDDLGRQFVAASRPALLRQEPGQATLLKRTLRLIERRPREVEGRRRGRDRVRLDFDAADHFVFDLDEVAGIEKLVGGKDRIGDLVGLPIQRAIGAQGLDLGIASGRAGSGRHGV
jgi:hypothetical protein